MSFGAPSFWIFADLVGFVVEVPEKTPRKAEEQIGTRGGITPEGTSLTIEGGEQELKPSIVGPTLFLGFMLFFFLRLGYPTEVLSMFGPEP